MSHVAFKVSIADRRRFEKIQAELISWYKKNRREFSWRKKIRDPYEVLVCEVMGQQTQASRIEQFLPRFLKRFPTIEALASAKKSEIIKQWQGLGYNRRALNLQRTAIELSGKPFPRTSDELLKLPGIGHYTANAILIFAFNKGVATVDVNIERLISRLYRKMPDTDAMLTKKEVFFIAEEILPPNKSRLWHEALMDFGAMICTKRNPKCKECPLFNECRSGRTLIKKTTIQLKNSSQEQKYFDRPKRIWRGNVLKLISHHNEIKESMIVKMLLNSENKSEFALFIREILGDLVKEGFCEISKKRTYHLGN